MILELEQTIRFTTCDFNNYEQIVPFAILNNFQDIAAEHAETCGVGFQKMLNKNIIWVLAKIKYKVINQPKRYEYCRIKTWPKEPRRFESEREYLLLNDDGILVKATSKWCLFDIKSNRITLCKKEDFNGEFSNVINFKEGAFDLIPFEKEKSTFLFTYTVRHSDLDRNQHMNNAKYGTIVYDALMLSENEYIDELQIDYVSQAFLGDNISIYVIKNNKERYIYGLKDENLVFKSLVKLL